MVKRILSVRKRLKWSQDNLATKVGTSTPIIRRYERKEIKSTIDIAKSLADALGVTVDFLLGNDDTVINKEIFQKVKDIESLTEEERNKIYDLIIMAISYHKTKKAILRHKKKHPEERCVFSPVYAFPDFSIVGLIFNYSIILIPIYLLRFKIIFSIVSLIFFFIIHNYILEGFIRQI